MKLVTLLLSGFVCFSALICNGDDVSRPNPYSATLQTVKAAELPAKAAEIVTRAKGNKDAAIQVVKAAVQINPAAAPAVVGAISRANPDIASDIAGVAAAEQ